MKKESKAKNTNRINRKPGDISIFTILFIIIVIAIFVGIYFGIRWIVITLRYKPYTDKMYDYGYEVLYDNSKASSTEKVSKSDLIKVVMGISSNTTDVSNVYYLANNSLSATDNWFNYLKYMGLGDIVKNSNFEDNANKIESIMLIVKSVESIIGADISQTELKMSEKALSKFTADERIVLSKAVTLGIIKNKNSALQDKTILKGELNKILITLAEEYSTIYYGSKEIDSTTGQTLNTDVNIVTNKEDKPKNYKEYPYIVDNIEKEVYEQELKVVTERNFETPKEVYKTMGYLYQQIDEKITRYFNAILNVDYNNITNETFLNSIQNEVVYYINEDDVNEYVEYVKQNKIKLEGEATPLLPIMYNNGEQYVVRTKITFKVISSDSKYNLLFGDEKSKIKYNGDEITMYVDLPMGMTLNSNTLLVNINCLGENIVGNNTKVIVEK